MRDRFAKKCVRSHSFVLRLSVTYRSFMGDWQRIADPNQLLRTALFVNTPQCAAHYGHTDGRRYGLKKNSIFTPAISIKS